MAGATMSRPFAGDERRVPVSAARRSRATHRGPRRTTWTSGSRRAVGLSVIAHVAPPVVASGLGWSSPGPALVTTSTRVGNEEMLSERRVLEVGELLHPGRGHAQPTDHHAY